MISEKKLLVVGSSCSSNTKKKKKTSYYCVRFHISKSIKYQHLACLSHNAEDRISHNRIVPLLLLYTNKLHSSGWNSAAVITSVSSSMLVGLISTMSINLYIKEK